jgi:YD repeat-containing protein
MHLCKCALDKLKCTSMPHAQGATAEGTTNTYNGSGRTLTTTLPDGSATTYLHQGNTTKITDAARKRKRFGLSLVRAIVTAATASTSRTT